MAFKDLRASLVTPQELEAMLELHRAAEIQRVFLEIAIENGLADMQLHSADGRPEDHSVVVYDKFTPHQR
jgi:hypothetical protein